MGLAHINNSNKSQRPISANVATPPKLNGLSALTIILILNQVTVHLKRCNPAVRRVIPD